MRTLLNRIDTESAFWDNVFLLAKIVLVSAFIFVLVFGVRLLIFYPKVEGSIVKIIRDDKNEFIASRGRLTSHDCMSLWLDSFTYRFIHRETQYADLFKPGDEVKLWYYRMHGEYQIVQAKRGDEMLMKHNSILANIVFVLMVGSFILVLLEFIVKRVLPKRD